MQNFFRIQRLPPYVFSQVQDLKIQARQRGEDIIDFGMGNPDQATPPHIVEKLVEAAQKGKNHRYSASRGITRLRHAISAWYGRHYNVDIDPETEAIVTLGVKEGLSHLVLAMLGPGDVVLTPTPTYPIHMYSVIIAGGEVRGVDLGPTEDFFENLTRAYRQSQPRPKALIMSFPHNPTTSVVDLEFFKKVVAFAREHDLYVIHDLAYADIVFDGYRAPSLLAGAGSERNRRGVLLVIQELQYAGLACRILRRQQGDYRGPDQDQELFGLRDVPADPNCQYHRAEWTAGLRVVNRETI